jgi:DnaK suppressor protein
LVKKSARKPAKKKVAKKATKRRAKAAGKGAGTARKTAGRAKPARASTRKKTAKPRPARKAAGKSRTDKAAKSPDLRRHSAPTSAVPLAPTVAALPVSAEGLALAKPARAMTRAECEPFRRLLLEKRAQLVGDVSTLQSEALSRNRQDASGDLSNMPIHMADLGTDNYEQEFTLGLIEGERRVLGEIDEALERIERGTYGVCVATGRPIGKARLRAKPWAKYCYEYTLAQERGQKGSF